MPYKDKEKRKEYMKQWRTKNPEKNREANKKWRAKNPEKNRQKAREYYHENKNKIIESLKVKKEDKREYDKKHYLKIKDKKKEYVKKNMKIILKKQKIYVRERYKNDIQFRLREVYRSRVLSALKKQTIKKTTTLDLLGVSKIQTAVDHLTKQFKKGMSWDNHGEWHIDHIIPCASFDLTKESEQKKCFHYTNLQPLWAVENLQKGARLEWRKS